MQIAITDLDELSEDEFEHLEQRVNKLLATWQVKNLSGAERVFHDDQHIGEPRRELHATKHSSADIEQIRLARLKPVVDSLEGNSLIHALTTPIIEVNDDCTKARAEWWSIGVEGLSKHRETPTAIWSFGVVAGAYILEDAEWTALNARWQRTVKAEYHAGWVHSMLPTNTRPPLTPEQDRQFLGRYAYRPHEVREATPEPPAKDTWATHPDESDESWKNTNMPTHDRL